MKVRISKVKSWKAVPVEKCICCSDRCTQKICIATGLVSEKKFPVCNKHFTEWLNNELELQLNPEEL